MIKEQLLGFFVAHGQVKGGRSARITIVITEPGGRRKTPVLHVFQEHFGGKIYRNLRKDGRTQVYWTITRKGDRKAFAEYFIEHCRLPTHKVEQLQAMLVKMAQARPPGRPASRPGDDNRGL